MYLCIYTVKFFYNFVIFVYLGLLKNVENLKSSQNDESKDHSKTKSSNQSVPDFSELHGSAQPQSRPYTQAQKDLAQRLRSISNFLLIVIAFFTIKYI